MRRAALYLLAGAVMDAIVTAYYLAVDSRALFSASTLSALITLVSMFAVNGILAGEGGRRRAALILAYALGNGVGTAAVMALRGAVT
jgi:hypothetical protein